MIDIFSIIKDVIVITFLTTFLCAIYNLMAMAHKNAKDHEGDRVAEMHITDHILAAWIAMVGASIGVVASALHIVDTHLLRGEWATYIGIAYDISMIVLLVSGWLFIDHMRKEETKGHVFYLREYGESK